MGAKEKGAILNKITFINLAKWRILFVSVRMHLLVTQLRLTYFPHSVLSCVLHGRFALPPSLTITLKKEPTRVNARIQKWLITVGGGLPGHSKKNQWCSHLLVDPLPVCPFKVINKFCRLLMSDFTALRESLQSTH